tara:strand:- start:834 stop:965 length:132 start_codon:yes stop_codon:yes gene_type:complete
MNTLYKQDGTAIEVNDGSLSHALSLGWTESKPEPKKPEPKKAK